MPYDPTPEDHDGPLVDHDTARQVVTDIANCHSAIGVLMELLRDSGFDALDGRTGTGLAVLLEATESRLGLAMDGLRDMVAALGVEGAPFPHGAPG